MTNAKLATQLLRVPDAAQLDRIMEVYERGLTVDALRLAQEFAPLPRWGGVDGCILAARIAANSGAPRLSMQLAVRARKTAPANPDAIAQYGYEVLNRRGPIALWEMLRDRPEEDSAATPEQRAELLALKGSAATVLRDFPTAERLINRAAEIAPDKPWLRLQKAFLLEHMDRVEEALEVAESSRALHKHPFYRPAIQSIAHLLQLLDRDDDAILLLKEADGVLQNSLLAAQLCSLLIENGRWVEADAALDRYATLAVLIERPFEKWLASQRARANYHLGRRVEAAQFAGQLDDDFHKEFAGNLAAPAPEPERVQLEVTFVRQHFKTCAPASLATIGRFWNMPADHLKMAEAVCYDGTPGWQQRQWAEQNGWVVRDFSVTWESTLNLIERGIPFAISTVEATNSHMMVVVGFDRTRGTLLLRDPSQPYIVENHAAKFFEHYRPFGPLGTVFLPVAEQTRLDGLTLPESEIHDAYHDFVLALLKHDRPTAAGIAQKIEETFSDARIAWETRLHLAAYDANNVEQIRCLDKLLEKFPGGPARLLRRFACMHAAPRDERIRFLQQACTAKNADPALYVELARTLQGDARQLPEARRHLKRATRFRPLDSDTIGVRANLSWDDGQLEEATELYRFAANLEGYREHLYQSWFVACRQTRRTDEAIKHLQDRFERFGGRSAQPALTLAWAWREMEQPVLARTVLAEARKLRADDGQLLLRSADILLELGESVEAERLLNESKNRVRVSDWLKTAARMAEGRLNTTAALQYARDLLELEPLALDAHGTAARALLCLEGTAAALAFLKQASGKFPHHCGLRRMVLEWSREAGSEAIANAARELLRIEPHDAWACRELAFALSKLDRGDEALAAAGESARIEPRNTFSFSVLGFVQRSRNAMPEARMHYRRAVELSADNGEAIRALLDLAGNDQQRRDEIAFIEQELLRQVVQGNGLLAFLDIAQPVIGSERLLKLLQQAHIERPDLWHAWSALVSQLGHLGRLDEALEIASHALKKFSHLPSTWLDLSLVHRWRNEPQKEIEAARDAFEINPGWSRSTLNLADALERSGRLDDAREAYERALLHSRDDAELLARHAHVLWRLRRKDAAFSSLEKALQRAPGYDWAWGLLREWTTESGDTSRLINLARSLAGERPGEMQVWLTFARVLNGPADMPERLDAVEKALSLTPHSIEAWDMKAELLALSERFDEAIKACEEGLLVCAAEHFVLQGRRAWIEARRRQIPEAVRLMRDVLHENSNYLWGWSQLATWLLEQAELTEAATALEQMLRIRPRDPWVHRQLGFLKLKQNDRVGACKEFDAALHLAPTDVSAAINIFDLQLKADDLPGAATTLRLMEIHQPGGVTLASRVQLHLLENDRSGSNKALQELCAMADQEPWPLNTAVDAFKKTGRASRALKILRRALKKSDCNPQAAAAATELLLSKRHSLRAVWLFLRLKPGEACNRAAATLVHGLVPLKSKLLFRWILCRRAGILRGDDAAWGQVGYALSTFKCFRIAADWLSDWQPRQNVQPWMLFNLCFCLRQVGRYDQSTIVARHVLEKWGHREGSADMRLFLAVEDALAGNVPEAMKHLEHASPRDDVPYDRQLLALARGLVQFRHTAATDPNGAFKSVRRQLARDFPLSEMPRNDKDVRRTFKRVGTVLTENGGGPAARLWFTWRLNWHWFLGPFLPLAYMTSGVQSSRK